MGNREILSGKVLLVLNLPLSKRFKDCETPQAVGEKSIQKGVNKQLEMDKYKVAK